jgi:hypothetical protein
LTPHFTEIDIEIRWARRIQAPKQQVLITGAGEEREDEVDQEIRGRIESATEAGLKEEMVAKGNRTAWSATRKINEKINFQLVCDGVL